MSESRPTRIYASLCGLRLRCASLLCSSAPAARARIRFRRHGYGPIKNAASSQTPGRVPWLRVPRADMTKDVAMLDAANGASLLWSTTFAADAAWISAKVLSEPRPTRPPHCRREALPQWGGGGEEPQRILCCRAPGCRRSGVPGNGDA
jgi:hypothetical protein